MAFPADRDTLIESDASVYNPLRNGSAKNSTTFSAALSAIGSIESTLLITNGTWSLTSSHTVADNINLWIPQGGVLDVGAGTTLTINGAIQAGPYQIFSGSGTVRFGRSVTVFPQWWGAVADGTNNDTSAIQSAVDSIPGATVGDEFTNKGSGCVYFPMPPKGGYYRVESTINIEEKWNIALKAPMRYDKTRGTGENRTALIKWHGGTTDHVLLFSNNQSVHTENISVDGRGTVGLIGVAFGPDATQSNTMKYQTHVNMDVKYCDVGIRVADFASNGPDAAHILFLNPFVEFNVSQGFAVNSGNAVVEAESLAATNNGYAATGGKKGANVYLGAGNLTLTGYTSAGSGANQPDNADIEMENGGLRINGAWSDTHGPFLNAAGSGVTNGVYLNGVRHNEGSMNDTNTPKSIVYSGASPLVLSSCYLFNDVEVNSGNASHVIDLGTRFIQSGATFNGAQVTTQRGYIGIGKYGQNEARVEIGRPARSDVGSIAPLTVWGDTNRPLMILATSNTDMASTVMMNGAAPNLDITLNGYFDGTNFRSAVAGPVGRCVIQGTTTPRFLLQYDTDSTAANEIQTYPTTAVDIQKVSNGTGTPITITLGVQKMTWSSAVPTAGTWTSGDVVWNQGPSTGQPMGWMCTASGTPGTWQNMPNL